MRIFSFISVSSVAVDLVSCGAFLSSSKGKDQKAEGTAAPSPAAAVKMISLMAETEADLPACTTENKSQLVYVKDLKEFRYCDQSETWTAVDVKGAHGDAGATGSTGSAGIAGKDGLVSSVALFDSSGKKLGYYLRTVSLSSNTYEIMTIDGARTVVDLDNATFSSTTPLVSANGCAYTSADCSGTCFGFDLTSRGFILKGFGTKNHLAPPKGASVNMTANSSANENGTCTASTFSAPNAIQAPEYTGVLTEATTIPLFFAPLN
jgi:hypothetical protein